MPRWKAGPETPAIGSRVEYGAGGETYAGTVVANECSCGAVHVQCANDVLHHVSLTLFSARNGSRWARVLS